MRKLLVMMGILGGMGLGCSPDKSKPNVEIIQDMMESPAFKAQEYDEESPDHRAMRLPPEHTVPIGFHPYRYAMDAEAAGKALKNPYAQEGGSPEILIIGKRVYETQCAVCHGIKGQGGMETSVGQKMALKPPSLLSEKVRRWSDGRIYHVVTKGQGIMQPYESHVPQNVRWQLINYIRNLQTSASK